MAGTAGADPVLHCYNLHEWAMQYRPSGVPEPPSAKYQKHLPLRVSQQVINETVERKGVSCTHIDALRFFVGPALPLNSYGGEELGRADQPRLDQPACVHASMDLLKMALKLQPFVDPSLVVRSLEAALLARRLDVAASPYDATEYGVEPIPIETHEGRALFRKRQNELMGRVQPVRRDLLAAYRFFVRSAFAEDAIDSGMRRLPSQGHISARGRQRETLGLSRHL